MTELTKTQTDVIDSLKRSYENYNDLVQHIIDLTDKEYESMYALRKAILTAISESLHEAGLSKDKV